MPTLSASIPHLIVPIVGIVAGLLIFLRGFRLLARRRLLLSIPQSRIRSASLGLVETNGQATGPYHIRAPISGSPCFYYRVIAWQFPEDSRDKQWKKVAEETLYVPFFLDDGTGKLLVDPRGADIDLHRDFRREFNDSLFSPNDCLPDNVRSFLYRHGIPGDGKIRVDEYCIKPRTALYVVGTVAENPGLSVEAQPIVPPSREKAFTLHLGTLDVELGSALKMAGTPVARKTESAPATQEIIRLTPQTSIDTARMSQQQRIAAALLKAGIQNPAVWAGAGVSSDALPEPEPIASPNPSQSLETADRRPEDTASSDSTFEPKPRVVLMKGTNDPTFLISWRNERELASSLRWKSALMLAGGPALTLCALYLLLAYLALM